MNCPECKNPARVLDKDFKRIFRSLLKNNRYYCSACRITWRKNRPGKISELKMPENKPVIGKGMAAEKCPPGITVEDCDGLVLININIDLLLVPDCGKFSQIVNDCLKTSCRIALCFSDKILISGSFLGFLMEKVKRIKSLSGEMVIITGNPDLLDLLAATNLGMLINIYPRLEDFLAGRGIGHVSSRLK
jgi:hypothetical protein